MEHNNLPRIENLTDYRGCTDQDFVKRKQAYLVSKLNTLKVRLEERLVDRALQKEPQGIFAGPGTRGRNLIYEIQTIEALLEPTQWDLRLKYLRRELMGLPFELRNSLLQEFESGRFGTSDTEDDERNLPSRVRIQFRTTPMGRAKLDRLIQLRSTTITSVVVTTLEDQLQNDAPPTAGPRRSALSKKLAVWLPFLLHRDLQQFARRHRVTASEAVRLMVAEYLRKTP